MNYRPRFLIMYLFPLPGDFRIPVPKNGKQAPMADIFLTGQNPDFFLTHVCFTHESISFRPNVIVIGNGKPS